MNAKVKCNQKGKTNLRHSCSKCGARHADYWASLSHEKKCKTVDEAFRVKKV